MGQIFSSPTVGRLVEFCARELRLALFVETGTFRGESAAWAAERFPAVVTIERDADLFAQARDRCRQPNLTMYHGDSATWLSDIVDLPKSKLFWLDAHWCGGAGNAWGVDNQCPVAGELAALRSSTSSDVIIIDDFHMFARPPGPPFRAEQWPSLDELFVLSRELPQQKIFVAGNVLVLAGDVQARKISGFLRSDLTD